MNKKNLFAIIFSSIVIGFIYNSLSPGGISLIREVRKLDFADDVPTISDTVNSQSEITNSTQEKKSSELKPSENVNKEKFNDEVEFKKPVAIKIDKAYELFQKGVKFIDARMPEEFNEGHIKGAINIPFDGDESYREALKSIKKDEIIVTYCSGTECDLSILLGDELFEKGYKKVYIFFGGWNDWLAKNYPIAKGAE